MRRPLLVLKFLDKHKLLEQHKLQHKLKLLD
jgi:hypothetical protein